MEVYESEISCVIEGDQERSRLWRLRGTTFSACTRGREGGVESRAPFVEKESSRREETAPEGCDSEARCEAEPLEEASSGCEAEPLEEASSGCGKEPFRERPLREETLGRVSSGDVEVKSRTTV
jgi:hypothetical protein